MSLETLVDSTNISKSQTKRKKYKEKQRIKKAIAQKEQEITENLKKLGTEHISESIRLASELWRRVRSYVDTDESNKKAYQKLVAEAKAEGREMPPFEGIFIDKTDKEKIKLLTEEKIYDDFYNEYPIVGRYMICMGRFELGAFVKFINKVKNIANKANANANASGSKKIPEKGHNEDQWVQRQADYVRYLWEATQKRAGKRIETKESKAIWQQSYKAIKDEFSTFKEDHDKATDILDKKKKAFNAERFSELKSRILNGEQSLDDNSLNEMNEMLKDAVYKKRSKDVINELNEQFKRKLELTT